MQQQSGTAGEGAEQGQDTAAAESPGLMGLMEGPSTLIEMRRLTWELEHLNEERAGVLHAQSHFGNHYPTNGEEQLTLSKRQVEIRKCREKVLARLAELTQWLQQ